MMAPYILSTTPSSKIKDMELEQLLNRDLEVTVIQYLAYGATSGCNLHARGRGR